MEVKQRMRAISLLFIFALAFGNTLYGQESGVLGYWKEPGGSIFHIAPCADQVCATLVDISLSAPARVDGKNPDASLRSRSLCGLQIGEGFHLSAPDKAEGGMIYDPKSGKTYHGVMISRGKELHLRGYIGVSLFGRTETWARTGVTATCRS